MTETITREIFSDRFPSYCFLYTLREFRRLNGVTKGEMDTFVEVVSGKGLSVRDIDGLARLYFRGGEMVREQIRTGDIHWALKQIRVGHGYEGFSEFEKRTLRDLEILGSSMGRLTVKLGSRELLARPFFGEASLLVSGILSRSERFLAVLRRFHDRCGQESGGGVTTPAGDGDSRDISQVSHEPQFRQEGFKKEAHPRAISSHSRLL
jgi:hypothetical protein